MQSLDFADREYLIYEKDRLTYREHYDSVVKLSNLLMMQFAIRKGDRIAIAMRNYPEYATIFWAALSIGANHRSHSMPGAAEPSCILPCKTVTPRFLFADKQRLDSLQPFLASLSICACVCVRHEYPQALSYRQLLVEAPLRPAGSRWLISSPMMKRRFSTPLEQPAGRRGPWGPTATLAALFGPPCSA